MEEFLKAREEYEAIKEKYRISTINLTKNKVYEIKYILWDGTIKVRNDAGKILYFSVNDKRSEYSAARYEDFFVTLIEARKKKLDDLADENFNQFLKKIKK